MLAERDAMIAERDAAIKERDMERAEREKLESLHEHVRHHLLHKANDRAYGAKSEQLEKLAPDQLAELALEDLEIEETPEEAAEEKKQPSCRA